MAPVTLALVDAGGGEEWLELVRGALAAALEALPPSALFGLVTFGTHVRARAYTGPCVGARCLGQSRSACMCAPVRRSFPMSLAICEHVKILSGDCVACRFCHPVSV